jgi:hypothetical protein
MARLGIAWFDTYDSLLAVTDLWTASSFDSNTWRKVVAPHQD